MFQKAEEGIQPGAINFPPLNPRDPQHVPVVDVKFPGKKFHVSPRAIKGERVDHRGDSRGARNTSGTDSLSPSLDNNKYPFSFAFFPPVLRRGIFNQI